ncbi:hypothetical protein AAVH_38665, partial [Aphelenchoides avenae]
MRVQWTFVMMVVGAWAAGGKDDGRVPDGKSVDVPSQEASAWLERVLAMIEAGTAAWAPVEGAARASTSALSSENAAVSAGHSTSGAGTASDGPSATDTGVRAATVVADGTVETGAAGGASANVLDGVDAATGTSDARTTLEDKDERHQKQQAMVQDAQARLQKRLRKLRRRAERRAAAAATEEVSGRTEGDGALADAGTGQGASGGGPMDGQVDGRQESVAAAGGNASVPSDVNVGAARTGTFEAARWMRFSLAIAAQLEQRAAAIRLRDAQRAWVADREPHTSAGPSAAQVSAMLDRMPDELRFPPALLDALLAEVVGGGVYVDLSGDGDFNELVARDLGTTSVVGCSDMASQGSGKLALKEQREPVSSQSDGADEGNTAEKSASEATDALGPIPEGWLVAARSWHKARRCIDRRDHERIQVGFKCPCATCRERGGRFSAREFRGYVQHFGRGPFGFRFACPVDGCKSTRRTREQFIEHLRESHWVDTKGE